MKIIILTLALCLLVAADPITFCMGGPPGMYCNDDRSGFNWCLAAPYQSVEIMCPTGTVCNCFNGPTCTSVPTVGTGSPCGYPSNFIPFPLQYFAEIFTTEVINAPITTVFNNISIEESYDAIIGNKRDDTTTITSNSPGVTQTTDFDFANNGNGQSVHIHQDGNTCQTTLSSFPSAGVPSSYQFLRLDVLNGEDVNVYYWMNGGQNNGLSSTYIEIYTTRPSNGFVIPRKQVQIDNMPESRVSTTQTTLWTTFITAQPDPSTWNIPAICSLNP